MNDKKTFYEAKLELKKICDYMFWISDMIDEKGYTEPYKKDPGYIFQNLYKKLYSETSEDYNFNVKKIEEIYKSLLEYNAKYKLEGLEKHLKDLKCFINEMDNMELKRPDAIEPADKTTWDYTIYDDKTVCINKYKGSNRIVTIPEYIHNKKVVYLDGTFCPRYNRKVMYDINEIKKIILPNSIKYVGYSAFSTAAYDNHKPNLTTVILSSELEEIGCAAFLDSSITSIAIPDKVKVISDSAFSNCKRLKKVEIPDSVTEFGKEVFFGCVKLETIKMSKNIKTIHLSNFVDCDKLKDLYIPNPKTDLVDDLPSIIWARMESKINSDLVIHASKDSKAIEFAKKNGIKYIAEEF